MDFSRADPRVLQRQGSRPVVGWQKTGPLRETRYQRNCRQGIVTIVARSTMSPIRARCAGQRIIAAHQDRSVTFAAESGDLQVFLSFDDQAAEHWLGEAETIRGQHNRPLRTKTETRET